MMEPKFSKYTSNLLKIHLWSIKKYIFFKDLC